MNAFVVGMVAGIAYGVVGGAWLAVYFEKRARRLEEERKKHEKDGKQCR